MVSGAGEEDWRVTIVRHHLCVHCENDKALSLSCAASSADAQSLLSHILLVDVVGAVTEMTATDRIGDLWMKLYSYNPKIQAFAVIKDSQVVWQTSNWDLVPDAEVIAQACKNAPPRIVVGGIEYTRIYSDDTSFIASAEGEGGHILVSLVDGATWVVGWATPDAVPELAQIDLGMAAVALAGTM